MRTKKALFAFVLLALGFLAGRFNMPVVHAQASSPSYGCPSSGSGGPAVSNCAQYLIQINSARLGGGPKVSVYQLQSNPVDISALDGNGNPIFQLTQSGFGSLQYFRPAPSTETLSIAVTQP